MARGQRKTRARLKGRLAGLERQRCMWLDAGDELSVTGIDPDDLPLVEIHRDLDDGTGLDGCGLGATLNGITLETGVRLGNLDLDEHRGLDAEKLGVGIQEQAVVVLLEPLGVVTDEVDVNGNLLEGLVVHEVVRGAVVVEVLHLLGDELHALELRTSVAGLVDGTAGLEVLDLVADERATLARLDVLELDNGVVLAVDLETHAVLEVRGADGCHWSLFSLVALAVQGMPIYGLEV